MWYAASAEIGHTTTAASENAVALPAPRASACAKEMWSRRVSSYRWIADVTITSRSVVTWMNERDALDCFHGTYRGYEERKERCVVAVPDAVVDPLAVVIAALDTVVALRACLAVMLQSGAYQLTSLQ
jgi:hypothetical protein